MLPAQLRGEDFRGYPQRARELAISNFSLLKQLPLAFLPLLLREVKGYDWKFPAERDEVDRQFRYLHGLSSQEIAALMAAFANLKLSAELEGIDWINAESHFSDHLSAYLWATHQIDAFRAASENYVTAFNAAVPEVETSVSRLAVAILGRSLGQSDYPLFRKLRPHGVRFTRIDPKSSAEALMTLLAERTRKHPLPYGHWLIDGSIPAPSVRDEVTSIAYGSLAATRGATIRRMRHISEVEAGPEALRTHLLDTDPAELALGGPGIDPVMNRFAINMLTEGSGTQIYSTTFVQWTAREALRRARPLTIIARFTPRQTEESADEELSGAQQQPALDPAGSLVDADMGAYYTWLNLQRLSGASRSTFFAWAEASGEAVAIGPSLARGTECHDQLDLGRVLERMMLKA